MKKVICVDDTKADGLKTSTGTWLKMGEVYHVVREGMFEDEKGVLGHAYVLMEFNPLEDAFDSWRFIPISDIDETEIHKETLTKIFQPL